MTPSRPVEPRLLTDQVYEFLHRAIVNGEMPAGTRLRVRDVAAEVGTSVMPVREAIRRLEEAGLAEREPHKGAVVRGLTLSELVPVYDTRRLLEGEAAALGAARIDRAGCDRMQAELDLMRRALDEGRLVDHLDHDENLLKALFDASGNPVLVGMIVNLWQQCRVYKVLGLQLPQSPAQDDVLWRHQAALLQAARTQDAQAARAASAASLDEATERIRAQLAAQHDAAQHEAGQHDAAQSDAAG